MILADFATFTHMPRTGGHWIKHVLGDDRITPSPYHEERDKAPSGKPVVGFVREPFSWYASCYAFYKQYGIQHPVFGRPTLEEAITGALSPSESLIADTAAATKACWLTRTMYGISAEQAAMWQPGESYYQLHCKLHLHDLDYVGRVETLKDDFMRIMAALGIVDMDMLRRAAVDARVNCADGDAFHEEELAALVRETDGWRYDAI